MATIKVTDVNRGAALLKKLAAKADYDGDGKLSTWDVSRASTGPAPKKQVKTRIKQARKPGVPGAPVPKPAAKPPAKPAAAKSALDDVTVKALDAAIYRGRSRSEFQVKDIQTSIEDVRKKLVALDSNRDGKIDDAELKHLQADGKALANALLGFSAKHASASVKDFDLGHAAATDGTTWKPSTPFRAPPANATPVEVVAALVKHFDAFSNDNRWPGMVSRWVLGPTETKGIVAEIAKLPAARAKAVLRELSAEIRSTAAPRPYVDPAAVKYLDALASKLGVTASFVGVKAAPGFPGY